ncbi:MAG: hypothetical protein AVDCRST_MAG74-3153 [uncultured Pyrinomonadaceae bacterium]|uniref:Uncharacterized protein n=1 Tax=uncultured Pyrinomonadaceae bacterium TaxID=2283094 RepID=A0A6J4PSJ6_9BACT|nr:MAG: hypothetical protein AVDCRST_MAG74-3153 [uncultured Pyrinomonadaceae bacterium]
MKHRIFNRSKQIFAVAVFALLMAGAGLSAFAQTANQNGSSDPYDKILADGNPPLRVKDVMRTILLYEWLFSAGFSYEKKDEFQAVIVSEWKNGNRETIKFINEAIALSDQTNQMKKYAEREAVREKTLPAIINQMKTQMSDPKQQILRDVYRRANGANSLGTIAAETKVLKTGGALKDLVGDWMLQTGTPPGNMATAKFSFLANGRAQFSLLKTSQKANCFATETAIKEGTFAVDDARVALDFSNNKKQFINSCQPNGVKTETFPAENQTFTWQIKRDAQEIIQLCLTGANGATTCYRKAG